MNVVLFRSGFDARFTVAPFGRDRRLAAWRAWSRHA
jgi:hypothetical protein